MISTEAATFVCDAKQAADAIARFTDGRMLSDYQADEMLRSAVERQLGIVGEALNRLRQLDPALAATIPDLPHAIALRNILVHGYAVIDDQRIWSVIESDLDRLRATLAQILTQAPNPAP